MIFISTSDLLDDDWQFLAPVSTNPDMRWATYSGMPRNALEQLIRRPNIARYRAAFMAARGAKRENDAVLISHLPNMSAATNIARRRFCPDVPQIAFSFNFTDLPTGKRRRYLTSSFKDITEFVVFSTFEKQLYADYFDIPIKRICHLPWAMDPPMIGPDNPISDGKPYLCSIGGEGRDYALLAEVMRSLPQINMVIIARPHSIEGIDFPKNIKIFTNLPSLQTWRIAQDSMGMVIPLLTDQTACGHITLVGAQQLGIPLVITQSAGVADYVRNGATATLVPAKDNQAMIQAITRLIEDSIMAQHLADMAKAQADQQNSLSAWLSYFEDLNRRFAH